MGSSNLSRFGQSTKLLLGTVTASVGMLVVFQIWLGWTFDDPDEISVIVCLVC